MKVYPPHADGNCPQCLAPHKLPFPHRCTCCNAVVEEWSLPEEGSVRALPLKIMATGEVIGYVNPWILGGR